jgi:uncharacterized membrane protein
MGNLSAIGRVFYGVSIAALGVLTIIHHDFPYMLIPPRHSWINSHESLLYISGALLILAGACIVLKKWTMPVSLLLGAVLLLTFCFYFVPYEIIGSANFMHFYDWENAIKELTFAGGAFVIAGSYAEENKSLLIRMLTTLIPLGTILYSLTIISYGVSHFLYAREASDYIPSWIPYHLFWMYIAGLGLLASGIAILLKVKIRLAAVLLGAMIFIWVIILHIPKAIDAPMEDKGGEVASGFLALAYCGIAFVIAGDSKKPIAEPVNA